MGLAVCDGEPEICATKLKITMPPGTFERFLCYAIPLGSNFQRCHVVSQALGPETYFTEPTEMKGMIELQDTSRTRGLSMTAD